MKARLVFALLSFSLFSACAADDAAAIRSDAVKTPAADIVYMTPTAIPTMVPTLARYQPTATIAEPEPAARTALEPATCADALNAQYTAASDHCLAAPDGRFCRGGMAPALEPATVALDAPGAIAEAASIDSLHSPPLGDARGGGLFWLRLEEALRLGALMIGDLRIASRATANRDAPKWRSFTVASGEMPSDCDAAPQVGALALQSVYGQSAYVTINGVAAEINGTLIVLTQGDSSRFIAIEGQVRLSAFGQAVNLYVGQQLNLHYDEDDWSKPAQRLGNPVMLDYGLIEHLPVALFERPLPIPQPGYAQTQGGVNMRAAPDIESRLLFQVPAGETMSVLGISADRRWLHIRLGNGETGWMSAELLARNLGDIGAVYDLTPTPPQRLGAYADLASVNVPAGGNLREAPDTAFRIKLGLPFGQQVKLLARSPYSPWVKVDADGAIGWMALFTLTTKAVISSLPIDYSAPLPPRATPEPAVEFFSYGGGHAYPDPTGGY